MGSEDNRDPIWRLCRYWYIGRRSVNVEGGGQGSGRMSAVNTAYTDIGPNSIQLSNINAAIQYNPKIKEQATPSLMGTGHNTYPVGIVTVYWSWNIG